MAIYNLKMPPDTGDGEAGRHGGYQALYLQGRYDASPVGTRYHFKVIPTEIPASLVAQGKGPKAEWLVRIHGEAHQIVAIGSDWFSPAVVVPEAPEWGWADYALKNSEGVTVSRTSGNTTMYGSSSLRETDTYEIVTTGTYTVVITPGDSRYGNQPLYSRFKVLLRRTVVG